MFVLYVNGLKTAEGNIVAEKRTSAGSSCRADCLARQWSASSYAARCQRMGLEMSRRRPTFA
jgi:hypothetical protein